MEPVSVYILTLNEADKIDEALSSVLWADEVVVVDSFSTDATVEKARAMGARVEQVAFRGFGPLRNTAISLCTHQWIFSLDADERCTPEVQDEIQAVLSAGTSSHDAYYIPRRNYFMGRRLRNAAFYPDFRQPQLFRKGALSFSDEQVHETFSIARWASVGYMENALWQVPFKNFSELMHKADKYSTLGALKLQEQGKTATMTTAFFHGAWAFFRMYILKKGFVDGWAGFAIALGNFNGTFFRYAKLCEQQAGWDNSKKECIGGHDPHVR